MTPAILPDMTHWRGDLWRDGYRRFGPIVDENGDPPTAPCLYCRMQFRNKDDGSLGYELNSAPIANQGSITILNGASYEFFIPDQALPLAAGKWLWDFETYTTADHSDPPLTWFSGTLIVKQDVTHD